MAKKSKKDIFIEEYLKSKTSYKLLSKTQKKQIIQEIKKLYEYGMNLSDLAKDFRINESTLYYYSSNDNWKKGIIPELVAAQEILLETEELAKERVNIKTTITALGKIQLNRLVSYEKEGTKVEPTNERRENAIFTRIRSVTAVQELLYKVTGIRTEEEEIELEKAKIELNKLKIDTETYGMKEQIDEDSAEAQQLEVLKGLREKAEKRINERE